MPVKIARSAPRPWSGLPELLVAIHTSRQSCSRPEKRCVRLGVIRGIPDVLSANCLAGFGKKAEIGHGPTGRAARSWRAIGR